MELRQILYSQILRSGKGGIPQGGLHVADTVAAIRERYAFVNAPKSLDDFDFGKGVRFGHGKIPIRKRGAKKTSGEQTVVIGQFTIYQSALLVDSRGTTEELEAFLDDFLEWSSGALGIKFSPDQPIRNQIRSQLEVTLECGIPVSPFQYVLGDVINKVLKKTDPEIPPFELSALSWTCDPSARPGLVEGVFSIQRRDNEPFSSNVFFSQAPFGTAGHLAFLEQFEKLALKNQ